MTAQVPQGSVCPWLTNAQIITKVSPGRKIDLPGLPGGSVPTQVTYEKDMALSPCIEGYCVAWNPDTKRCRRLEAADAAVRTAELLQKILDTPQGPNH